MDAVRDENIQISTNFDTIHVHSARKIPEIRQVYQV